MYGLILIRIPKFLRTVLIVHSSHKRPPIGKYTGRTDLKSTVKALKTGTTAHRNEAGTCGLNLIRPIAC